MADTEGVYVVGDVANIPSGADGEMLPQLGSVALQSGHWAAANIRADFDGKARQPFAYRDKGSMATIGRAAAVVDLGFARFGGPLAWLAWLFIHILYLIGFRNRLVVFSQWVWSYVFSKRAARLITSRDWRLPS